MKKLYVNNNGNLVESNGFVLEAGNRGHLYGDGLFESIRVINGKPVNLKIHILRLLEGMAVMKMRIPNYFDEAFFEKHISEVLEKSEITLGGRVRLSIDRIVGGTYKPDTNEVSFFIEAYPLEHNLFTLNQKGLELDVYTTLKKERNMFSGFKTKNALLNVMASIEATEKGFDDLFLINDEHKIIESTSSNLFMVGNNILYTPGLDEGCVGGTMRMTVINLALENNLRVYESPVMPQNLFQADEVFLTNAIQGIQWVGGFRTKRFTNSLAQKLTDIINAHYS